jgi:hypothetical protein
MKTKTAPTFTATIYVGTYNKDTGKKVSVKKLRAVCQQYCDEIGLCVTVTETEFIYTGDRERGIAVGLINYPRFPASEKEIIRKAISLAERLMESAKQYKVSVVFPDETVMLSKEGD